ncbi:GntR family transcriptional regulator [uncultured Lactobacillus sp.]|uniref:GntR family transcriptional regulator n=1 Tax=uncultured Lactobacillus sp. TaxID=153152 RepID=UPI002630D8D0|nr:GntR family transcriptional regulator [uncultured Lactobacillus sp.]
MKETPKYLLIAQRLKELITSGEYKPNDQLPKEYDLANSYNVSRITVRTALQELENEGLIYRIQGAGTFVKSHSLTQSTIQGSLEPLNLKKYHLKLVDFEVGQVPKLIQEGLDLAPYDVVYTIKRIALDKAKKLIAFQRLFIPAKVIQGLNMSMMENSIYPIIAKRVNDKPQKAVREITLTKADDELQAENEIPAGLVPKDEPVLKCVQHSYLSGGKPFEWNETYYRITQSPLKQVIVL